MRTKRIGILQLAATVSLLLAVESNASATLGWYGAYATDSYSGGWLPEFCDFAGCYGWDTTYGFLDGMYPNNEQVFASGLPSTGAPLVEGHGWMFGDLVGADLVDVLWLWTHGGVDNGIPASQWSMWNPNVMVNSSDMRLGDDAKHLKLFVSYACHTLQNDEYWMDRLVPIFEGGLKIMVGSHDIINWGETMDEAGWEFAVGLQETTIYNAWHGALEDWWFDNDGAIIATGVSWGDCFDRLNSATYSQIVSDTQRPPLRNGAGWAYCGAFWDNL